MIIHGAEAPKELRGKLFPAMNGGANEMFFNRFYDIISPVLQHGDLKFPRLFGGFSP